MTSLSNRKNNIVPFKEIIFLTILKCLCMCVLSGCVNVNVLVSVCLHPDLGLCLLCCGNSLCFKGTGCCLAPLKCMALPQLGSLYLQNCYYDQRHECNMRRQSLNGQKLCTANIPHTNTLCLYRSTNWPHFLHFIYHCFPHSVLITFHFIAT